MPLSWHERRQFSVVQYMCVITCSKPLHDRREAGLQQKKQLASMQSLVDQLANTWVCVFVSLCVCVCACV